jgi:hypothetical protein
MCVGGWLVLSDCNRKMLGVSLTILARGQQLSKNVLSYFYWVDEEAFFIHF